MASRNEKSKLSRGVAAHMYLPTASLLTHIDCRDKDISRSDATASLRSSVTPISAPPRPSKRTLVSISETSNNWVPLSREANTIMNATPVTVIENDVQMINNIPEPSHLWSPFLPPTTDLSGLHISPTWIEQSTGSPRRLESRTSVKNKQQKTDSSFFHIPSSAFQKSQQCDFKYYPDPKKELTVSFLQFCLETITHNTNFRGLLGIILDISKERLHDGTAIKIEIQTGLRFWRL